MSQPVTGLVALAASNVTPSCGVETNGIFQTMALHHQPARILSWRRFLCAILIAFCIFAPLKSEKPVAKAGWAYAGSTTRQLLDDLKTGEGKPPPLDTPAAYFNFVSHGWISEQTDLSRVAMQELSRRDQLGLLSIDDQRMIDQLALADFTRPIKSPGQVYIRGYLGARLLNGKLSSDELTELYTKAVRLAMTSDPVITQGDEVPLRLECDCSLPGGAEEWELMAHYKSISIDGNPAERSEGYFKNTSDPSWAFGVKGIFRGEVARTAISCSTLGLHRLRVRLQIDIRKGPYRWPEQRPIIFSQVVTLNSEFREEPPQRSSNVTH